MERYIMFDVGGTGIKYGTLDEKGVLISPISDLPSPSQKGKEEVFSLFAHIIEKEENVKGIGMAWPGPFDYEKGISLMDGLGKYQSIYGLNVGESINKRLNRDDIKYVFLHDVAAFLDGYARDNNIENERIIALLIGTGAGSSFYADGKIVGKEYKGVPDNGWIYNIPFRGKTIEDWVSSKGIKRLSKKYFNMSIDGKTLFDMAENRDEMAITLWLEFGEIVEEAILPFILAFKPDRVVLGGKISKAWKYFFPKIKEEFEKTGIELSVTEETSRYVLSGLYKKFGEVYG